MACGKRRAVAKTTRKTPTSPLDEERVEDTPVNPTTTEPGGRGEEFGQESIEGDDHFGGIEGDAARFPGSGGGLETVVGQEENADRGMAGDGVGFQMAYDPGNTGALTGEGVQSVQNEPNNASSETLDMEWWTCEKEDKLIDSFHDAPHLWDKQAPSYKTRNKYEMAYKAWSSNLLIPGSYKETNETLVAQNSIKMVIA